MYGKSKRMGFTKGEHTTKAIPVYVHEDLWEPSKIASWRDFRYFLSLINDYSRKDRLICLNLKIKPLNVLKLGRPELTQIEWKVKYFRIDNGLEFLGNNFNSLCDECVITRHRTIASVYFTTE